MLKYTFLFIFFSFLLNSCTYINKKIGIETESNTIALDTIIDFESVDAFPLFPTCDSIPSRAKQKVCFQIKISEFLYNALQKHAFIVPENVQDTAFVKIKINKNGMASLSKINLDAKTTTLLPTLDSILQLSIAELPKMKPAIKRSFPVTTEFTLPIVISNVVSSKSSK